MRHVVSAVEIVVNEYLPIAVDVIGAPVEEMQLADAEGSDSLYQTAEELHERHGIRIEIHKHKALPVIDANGRQTILGAVEVLNTIKFRHALERSVEPVLPAVVWTLQDLRLAARLCHNRRSMMAAHVEEGS